MNFKVCLTAPERATQTCEPPTARRARWAACAACSERLGAWACLAPGPCASGSPAPTPDPPPTHPPPPTPSNPPAPARLPTLFLQVWHGAVGAAHLLPALLGWRLDPLGGDPLPHLVLVIIARQLPLLPNLIIPRAWPDVLPSCPHSSQQLRGLRAACTKLCMIPLRTILCPDPRHGVQRGAATRAAARAAARARRAAGAAGPGRGQRSMRHSRTPNAAVACGRCWPIRGVVQLLGIDPVNPSNPPPTQPSWQKAGYRLHRHHQPSSSRHASAPQLPNPPHSAHTLCDTPPLPALPPRLAVVFPAGRLLGPHAQLLAGGPCSKAAV